MSSTNEAVSSGSRARLRAAFDRAASEMAALPAGSFGRVNLDIPAAAATALGALPQIRALRGQIADELPKFDLVRFDRLEDYTLALVHAHGAYLVASQTPRSLGELAVQARTLRDLLLADASALALRGLMDASKLAEIRSGSGPRDTTLDLVGLVGLYRARWDSVKERTGVTLDELELAEVLADRLLTSVGLREEAPVARSEAVDQRERAFALFLAAYKHVQRAVTYVRWNEGDAAQFVPSLYLGRARRRDNGLEDDRTGDLEEFEEDELTPAALPSNTQAAPLQASGKVGTPDSEPFAP